MFVLYMETTFACFAHKEFHHFSNFFHLMPVLFRCTEFYFLYEKISFNPTWCKNDIFNFVYINYIFLNFIGSFSREDLRQIEKMLAVGARLAQLVEHQTFNPDQSHIRLKWKSQFLYFIWKQFWLVFSDRTCSPLLNHLQINA